jgi:hypothetical protein
VTDLPLFDMEPLTFLSLSEADACRDCRRPVAGRWSRFAQGCTGGRFWVLCDDCIGAAA